MALQMYIAPEDQGQTVEVSYGLWIDTVYRKRYDRSDRTATYAKSEALDDDDGNMDDGDYWNEAPENTDWEEITAEQFSKIGDE